MTSDALGSAKRRVFPASGLDQSPKLIKEAPEMIEDIWAPAAQIATVGIFSCWPEFASMSVGRFCFPLSQRS